MDPPQAAPALDVLYHACRFMGDDAAATAWLRRGLRLAGDAEPVVAPHPDRVDGERVPLLGDSAGAHVPRGVVEAALDRTDREEELALLYRQRADLLAAAGDRDGAAYALLNLAHLRAAAARWSDALAGLRAAQTHFARGGCRIGEALARLSLARALAETGAADDAAREADAARDLAATCGARWLVAQARAAHVEVARARGDLSAADAARADAAGDARSLGNVPLAAELALLQAELALLRPAPRDPGALVAARAALDAFERAPPGARTAPQQVRALLAAAALAVLEPGAERAATDRRLQLALGRATRGLDQARARRLPELAWRAAATRAEVEVAQGDAAGALEDLVLALEGLRDLARSVDEPARAAYLAHPERVAVRSRFTQLRP